MKLKADPGQVRKKSLAKEPKNIVMVSQLSLQNSTIIVK